MIFDTIIKTFEEKNKRNWTTLYFAIDLHGTIINKYKGDEIEPIEFATEVLTELSSTPDIVLILFTSTYLEQLTHFYKWCSENNINFKYLNENPECPSTITGDFSKNSTIMY